MLQYPEIKPGAMPVIQSKPGAGKNSLIDILTRILGKNKVWECVDPQRDIFGSHNGKMRDAFLINVNEAGIKDFSGALGKLKSLVTEPFVSIRAMYQDVTILMRTGLLARYETKRRSPVSRGGGGHSKLSGKCTEPGTKTTNQ